jgi:hypothetical protein
MAELKINQPAGDMTSPATFTIEGLTADELRTLLYALYEARKTYERSAAKKKFAGVEDQAFLHLSMGELARLQFDVFLDHDQATREHITVLIGSDLDI